MNVSVILCFVLVLVTGRQEGSGDLAVLDDIDDVEIDGSGDDFEVLTLIPDGARSKEEKESIYDIHFDHFADYYENEEYEELMKNYNTEDNYEYTKDNTDVERDSVLKITRDNFADIEIKPKPPNVEDNFILETSHIFIMVGSGLVSFIVVMLAFFMCRKTMEKKNEKSIPFTVSDGRGGVGHPRPIVKNYQRVATCTGEYLQYSQKGNNV